MVSKAGECGHVLEKRGPGTVALICWLPSGHPGPHSGQGAVWREVEGCAALPYELPDAGTLYADLVADRDAARWRAAEHERRAQVMRRVHEDTCTALAAIEKRLVAVVENMHREEFGS